VPSAPDENSSEPGAEIPGEPSEAVSPGQASSAHGEYREAVYEESLTDAAGALRLVVAILTDLNNLGDREKAKVVDLVDDLDALNRDLVLVIGRLENGQSVSPELAVSATARVEMARATAQDAAENADGQLKGLLERIFRKLGRVGQKLLSMNLHLLPVREWTLSGEASALFVKGSISVTFGK
jgi:hypothetical protein